MLIICLIVGYSLPPWGNESLESLCLRSTTFSFLRSALDGTSIALRKKTLLFNAHQHAASKDIQR